MLMNQSLYEVIEEINHAIRNTQENLHEASKNARLCGKPACHYCENLGHAKANFAKTKPVLGSMIDGLKKDSTPNIIFDHHTRKEYGNYQAWITEDGYYINVWKIGGHSIFSRICNSSLKKIKVHSQGKRSDIIFYNGENPPTDAQIKMIREIIADSLMWDYCVCFKFSYDAHHPDPKFLEDCPF